MTKSTQLYANNAKSFLASGIIAADVSLTVDTGDGAKFPTITNPGDNFLVTLEVGSANEIVRCTARTGDVLTIVRAQEGTSAADWATGATVEMRVTRDTLTRFTRAQDRLTEVASVDNLEAPSLHDANSYLLDLNDDGGQPIVAMKDTSTKWRFVHHTKTLVSSTVSSATSTSVTAAAINGVVVAVAAGKYIIQFTSGALAGTCRAVTSCVTSTVNWATATSPTASPGDGFDIYQSDFSWITNSIGGFIATPYANATNTAEAIAATYSPAVPALVDNLRLGFTLDVANATSTPTFNPNALGPKTVVKGANAALLPGDLYKEHELVFNSGYDKWVVLNPLTYETPNAIANLSNINNLAGTCASNTQVGYTADSMILKDSNGRVRIFNSYTKTADITVAGAGGLDTGAEASNSWYFVWAIAKEDNTTSILLSLSFTLPTMPATYIFKCLIGAVRNNGSSNFVQYIQFGRYIQYTSPPTSIVEAAGAVGNPATPTWVAEDIQDVIPYSIAKHIGIIPGGQSAIILAPNTSYGGNGTSTNPPPHNVVFASGANAHTVTWMMLESTNIYWAAQNTDAVLTCLGYHITI